MHGPLCCECDPDTETETETTESDGTATPEGIAIVHAAENAAVPAENAATAPADAAIRFPVPRHPIYPIGTCSGCGSTDVFLQCPTCPTAACNECQSEDVEFVCVDEVDYCLPCSCDPEAAEEACSRAYEAAENALAENTAAAAVALAPTCAAEPEPTTRQQLLLLVSSGVS